MDPLDWFKCFEVEIGFNEELNPFSWASTSQCETIEFLAWSLSRACKSQ